WLVLGDGKLELPLVYIDDVVDAIVNAVDKRLTKGEVIQIIDPEHLSQEEVLGLAGGNKPILRLPRALVFALGKLSEYPLGALGKPSPIAKYRLQSALARLHYESNRAEALLDWKPRIGVREGIRRVSTANPAPSDREPSQSNGGSRPSTKPSEPTADKVAVRAAAIAQ
ncbi:MAG TPA: hypothetical protein VIV40_30335, partial [Kofleriaceae bacterium]